MADPQEGLKAWLTAMLQKRGLGSCAELARHLGLTVNAVTRMKCRDGEKERRRIQAHLVPKLAAFFGEWPPGFQHMDADEKKPRKPRKATKATQGANKDVLVQGVEGPVTVIDNSTNLAGDVSTVAGHAPPMLAEGAAELMGQVLVVVDEIYRAAKRKADLAELGRVAAERQAAILAACEDPAEYEYAIEIMKLRLRRELDGETDKAAGN